MSTLTVKIESLDAVAKAVTQTLRDGGAEQRPTLSFVDYATMHRILSPKRLSILGAMAGRGPLPYREVARRVGRDFKAVHSDLTALVQAGVIDRTEGGVVFPYDGLRFAFDIGANAA